MLHVIKWVPYYQHAKLQLKMFVSVIDFRIIIHITIVSPYLVFSTLTYDEKYASIKKNCTIIFVHITQWLGIIK